MALKNREQRRARIKNNFAVIERPEREINGKKFDVSVVIKKTKKYHDNRQKRYGKAIHTADHAYASNFKQVKKAWQ